MTDPDLDFCGLSLWVDGCASQDETVLADHRWLTIRAQMTAPGATISCAGPLLMIGDIKQFRDEVTAMSDTLDGEATLEGLEPGLKIVLRSRDRGSIQTTVEITPDHINQHHRFTVEADQSYLPGLILACDIMLERS